MTLKEVSPRRNCNFSLISSKEECIGSRLHRKSNLLVSVVLVHGTSRQSIVMKDREVFMPAAVKIDIVVLH